MPRPSYILQYTRACIVRGSSLVRRMKRVVLLLWLFCAIESPVAGDAPVRVTVGQLLASPEKFDRKRVDVQGFYVAFNDVSDLRAEEDGTGGPDNVIWIDTTPRKRPRVAASDRVENRRVRLVGTFHHEPRPYVRKRVPYSQRFQGYGSHRLYKHAILDITYFQPLR